MYVNSETNKFRRKVYGICQLCDDFKQPILEKMECWHLYDWDSERPFLHNSERRFSGVFYKIPVLRIDSVFP